MGSLRCTLHSVYDIKIVKCRLNHTHTHETLPQWIPAFFKIKPTLSLPYTEPGVMALCLTITQEAAIIRALRVTKPFTRLPHNTIWKFASLARAERLSCEHQPHKLFVDMEAGSVQRLCPLLCVLVALHPLELVLIIVLEAYVGEEDETLASQSPAARTPRPSQCTQHTSGGGSTMATGPLRRDDTVDLGNANAEAEERALLRAVRRTAACR